MCGVIMTGDAVALGVHPSVSRRKPLGSARCPHMLVLDLSGCDRHGELAPIPQPIAFSSGSMALSSSMLMAGVGPSLKLFEARTTVEGAAVVLSQDDGAATKQEATSGPQQQEEEEEEESPPVSPVSQQEERICMELESPTVTLKAKKREKTVTLRPRRRAAAAAGDSAASVVSRVPA
jgi:hypothetical protein